MTRTTLARAAAMGLAFAVLLEGSWRIIAANLCETVPSDSLSLELLSPIFAIGLVLGVVTTLLGTTPRRHERPAVAAVLGGIGVAAVILALGGVFYAVCVDWPTSNGYLFFTDQAIAAGAIGVAISLLDSRLSARPWTKRRVAAAFLLHPALVCATHLVVGAQMRYAHALWTSHSVAGALAALSEFGRTWFGSHFPLMSIVTFGAASFARARRLDGARTCALVLLASCACAVFMTRGGVVLTFGSGTPDPTSRAIVLMLFARLACWSIMAPLTTAIAVPFVAALGDLRVAARAEGTT